MKRALVLVALAACGGTPVDPAGLPSIDGYADWPGPHITTTTPVPGHGDTVRIVFANPVAHMFAHGGRYPIGSVIVKEIHARAAGAEPGALQLIEIMRKVGDGPGIAAPVDAGWIFSEKTAPAAEEVHKDLCYAQCHKQGPYDSAFFDHGDP